MKEKGIVPVTRVPPENPSIPDQVLTGGEAGWEDALGVFSGSPGYEWIDDPSPPNWSPKRGIIHRVRELLSEVSFAVRHPHAHKAFKNLVVEHRR